ncbi:PAQR family membrane homeostasis protein TrhA [Lihuaxuella thermophila]|uniref:Hemolysin III n=1 Tax=Lihuaxuella thermophila TaxID=1173111 RepID=A0A1H8D8A7_9BACL|nr:hemolysin III family protein [Lihuaxuella thermophila]SEN03386.1 hemolysin III [Lihuaxuella thermophila]
MKFLKMKEPASTWTHFIPFLAGIVGLVFLILESVNNPAKLVIMTIFGVSVILLYGASSLYHWIRTTPEKELILRKIDHMAIFILIAGTYTPVLYYGLAGAWKWVMLIAVWLLSFIGMAIKIWFIDLPRSVSTIFYLALGWIAVIPFAKLVQTLPVEAIILMIAGGVAYTIGGIIYATKILDLIPNKFGFHEVFHIFVSLGTLLHFFMIFHYIMPL